MSRSSIPSPNPVALLPELPALSEAEQRQVLAQAYTACREDTLSLAVTLTEAEYCQQAEASFSPVGWHLGHIAYTESLWLLEHLGGQAGSEPAYCRLFAADGLPKAERQNLPPLPVVMAYLEAVRQRVLTYLETAPVAEHLRWWCWLLQHEGQHAETMSLVLSLHRQRQGGWFLQRQPVRPAVKVGLKPLPPPISLSPATVELGFAGPHAIDNEQPPQSVTVGALMVDATPVTQGAYRHFMAAGGYENPEIWSAAGWAWQQQAQVSTPLYWQEDPAWERHPVCGVSFYEADAYARWVGKRLPTEAEWVRLARAYQPLAPYPWGTDWPTLRHCNHGGYYQGTTPVGQFSPSPGGAVDLLGNVWEWTTTWFEGYPGFQAFPYRGYSQAYFDGEHRVLRGGSWATRPWGLRRSVRNWYQPQVRQVLAGFRCVQGE